jgi:hypothetical protein
MADHFSSVGETTLLFPIEETTWETTILSPKAGEESLPFGKLSPVSPKLGKINYASFTI